MEAITAQMAKRGMKMRTWATSKGLDYRDKKLLEQISMGKIKGKKGRAKELKEMLELEGFKVA